MNFYIDDIANYLINEGYTNVYTDNKPDTLKENGSDCLVVKGDIPTESKPLRPEQNMRWVIEVYRPDRLVCHTDVQNIRNLLTNYMGKLVETAEGVLFYHINCIEEPRFEDQIEDRSIKYVVGFQSIIENNEASNN